MNREIKFRAWHKDGINNEYGDRRMIAKPLHRCDAYDVLEGKSIYKDWILMQYTGLKDKKGEEIYESDVVRFVYTRKIVNIKEELGNIMIVKFGEYMAGGLDYYANRAYGFYLQDIDPVDGEEIKGSTHTINCEICVVIGNIYENPELVDK